MAICRLQIKTIYHHFIALLGVGATRGADGGVEFSVPQDGGAELDVPQAPPEEDGEATGTEEWAPEAPTFSYDPDRHVDPCDVYCFLKYEEEFEY